MIIQKDLEKREVKRVQCPICDSKPYIKAYVVDGVGTVCDLGASVYEDSIYVYPLEHTKVLDQNVLDHLDEMADELANDTWGDSWVANNSSQPNGHYFTVRERKL